MGEPLDSNRILVSTTKHGCSNETNMGIHLLIKLKNNFSYLSGSRGNLKNDKEG